MTTATCKKVSEAEHSHQSVLSSHVDDIDFILRIEAGEKASERIKHLIFCFVSFRETIE